MFTGLVDDVGIVDRALDGAAGRELRIRCGYEALAHGESVAVNGACLTVRQAGAGWFDVAAIITTVERTTIGTWREGRRVNLERAMRLGDRLGGHLVQGHVDGVATVASVVPHADAVLVDLALPPGLTELMVPFGSVAVDGVSLTVNALPAPDCVQVSLIEYTRRHTSLGELTEGAVVHVEADIIGKFVRRLVAPYVSRGA